MIPSTFKIDSIYVASGDAEASSFVAALRKDETVAVIRVATGEYRTVVFTAEQEAEADSLPYDGRDGHEQVASRFLRDGELLVSVH